MMTSRTMTGGVTLAVGLLLASVGCDTPAEAGESRDRIPTSVASQPTPAPPPENVGTPTVPVALEFSFATDMRQVGGIKEDDALVCRKSSCVSGVVAFGPYTTAVPSGTRVATFHVSATGVSSPDRDVATFDVYDSASNQVLAQRPVKASEFLDGKQQSIELAFTAPETSKLEFRVGWGGEGELKMYRVEVR